MNDDKIGLFAEEFSTFKPCSGNQGFESLLERRSDFKETFPKKEEVRLRGLRHVKLEKENSDTINSLTCTYIVQQRELFQNCNGYRKKLCQYHARSSEAEVNKS